MPHGAAETATPQQVYFRLHNDDELIAKPRSAIASFGRRNTRTHEDGD
jgi:hypothetical protein